MVYLAFDMLHVSEVVHVRWLVGDEWGCGIMCTYMIHLWGLSYHVNARAWHNPMGFSAGVCGMRSGSINVVSSRVMFKWDQRAVMPCIWSKYNGRDKRFVQCSKHRGLFYRSYAMSIPVGFADSSTTMTHIMGDAKMALPSCWLKQQSYIKARSSIMFYLTDQPRIASIWRYAIVTNLSSGCVSCCRSSASRRCWCCQRRSMVTIVKRTRSRWKTSSHLGQDTSTGWSVTGIWID